MELVSILILCVVLGINFAQSSDTQEAALGHGMLIVAIPVTLFVLLEIFWWRDNGKTKS